MTKFENIMYYVAKLIMIILKYILFFIFISLAILVFSHTLNPEGVEGFMGKDRALGAFYLWSGIKKLFIIVSVLGFLISTGFAIRQIIVQKIHKNIKLLVTQILLGIILSLFYIIFLSIKENKEQKNRRFRLVLYFFFMTNIIHASWFIGGAIGDLLTILGYSISQA